MPSDNLTGPLNQLLRIIEAAYLVSKLEKSGIRDNFENSWTKLSLGSSEACAPFGSLLGDWTDELELYETV